MLAGGLADAMSPAQIRSVVESNARINAWHGSIRSGKTIASLLRWLIFVATAPYGGELVIVGKTRETIERNVLAPLMDGALFGSIAKLVTHTRGSNVAIILGRTVHLIGANDSKAEGKLRGMTCVGAYVDEATLLPKGFFQQLLGRLSVPGAKLFCTTNPDNPAHWFKKEFLNRAAHLNMRSWHFTLADNPALDPAYVAAISREYVGLWYRRFILGEWVVAEGAVYDMWDPDRHVVTALPHIDRWLTTGVDYGTVNPFAAEMVGLGEDGRLYVVAEWRYDSREHRAQMTDEAYSRALRGWWARIPRPAEIAAVGVEPEWVHVDPSAASFMTQLWADGVPNVVGADNEVVDGIRTVSTLLATDRLRVHSSCEGLIGEVGGYSWDEKAAERGDDKPIKVNDHLCDALRYGVHSTEWLWRSSIGEVAA